MESLGGDQLWFDRFLAEHSAILYYWVLIFMYLLSPKNAYAFSELVEWHATDTYTQVRCARPMLLCLHVCRVDTSHNHGGNPAEFRFRVQAPTCCCAICRPWWGVSVSLCLMSLCLQFVETNKEALAELPPPMAAAAYYRNEDLYMVRPNSSCIAAQTKLAAYRCLHCLPTSTSAPISASTLGLHQHYVLAAVFY